VVGGEDVTSGLVGFNLCGGVKGCTVGGSTSHHVVVDIHVLVAAVEGSLEWVTGVCGFLHLVCGTSCEAGTARKIAVSELLEDSLGSHWCLEGVFVFGVSVHVTTDTTDVVPCVEWRVLADGQHECTVSVHTHAHSEGGHMDVHGVHVINLPVDGTKGIKVRWGVSLQGGSITCHGCIACSDCQLCVTEEISGLNVVALEDDVDNLVTRASLFWVTFCESVDIHPAGDQQTNGTWVVVVEVDIVEGTVDIFSRCHTCGHVTCVVDGDFVILNTWSTLHAVALFAKTSIESTGTASSNVNWLIILQFTEAVLGLVTVSQVRLKFACILLTSDTTVWGWAVADWDRGEVGLSVSDTLAHTTILTWWVTLGDITLCSLPACATLGHHFVCCSFELTHGIFLDHDVISGVATQNLFEDESCWDDGPDIFAWLLFQFNVWLWDVTPVSEVERWVGIQRKHS
jgi:hypothetical protein